MTKRRRSLTSEKQLYPHFNDYGGVPNEKTIPPNKYLYAPFDFADINKMKTFEGFGSMLQTIFQIEENKKIFMGFIYGKTMWGNESYIKPISSLMVIIDTSDSKFPSNELAEYPYKLSKKVYQEENINYFSFIKNQRTIFKVGIIKELKEYIQERVRTYISAIAFENIKDGITTLQISDDGQFLFPYSKELLTRIPIDPLDSKPFLSLLHKELMELIKEKSYTREWGKLLSSNNSLYLQLNSDGIQ